MLSTFFWPHLITNSLVLAGPLSKLFNAASWERGPPRMRLIIHGQGQKVTVTQLLSYHILLISDIFVPLPIDKLPLVNAINSCMLCLVVVNQIKLTLWYFYWLHPEAVHDHPSALE